MASKHYLVGGAAAFLAAAAITACTKTKEVNMTAPADPLFASYVSLGNSLTAGMQSAGINDSTQVEAYPVLFAQSASTRFAQPLLSKPGCPPPIDNFITQTRVTPAGYPTSTSTSCYLRGPSSVTSVLNDVAVPGAWSFDPTSLTSYGSNALTTFVLGGLTQVQRALQANPTFVSVWIGNNDVLLPASAGILTKTIIPGAPPDTISMGVTTQAAFVTNYSNMIKGLLTSSTLKGGVLFAVVQVAGAPRFFPAHYLLDSADIRASFEAMAGTPVLVDPSCANPLVLLSVQYAQYIANATFPPVVMCKKGTVPANPLFGDLFVLDSVETPQLIAAINAYNVYIQAKADSLGWAYVDVNPAVAQLKAAGAIPPFPILTQPTKAFGDYITLDGVHISGLAHKLVANLMIDSVNARYGTNLQPIP